MTAAFERIEVTDIVTGEVWLCAGQSNMEMELCNTSQFNEILKQGELSGVRFFTVTQARAIEPTDNCCGIWKVCNESTVGRCSAVAFHFAHRVYRELGIPVGVVVCAVGATSVKQWLSRETLSTVGYQEVVRASYEEVQGPCVDPGITDIASKWHEPEHDDSSWKKVTLPSSWYAMGLNFNGAAWFRKTFSVPRAWINRECILSLGRLNDFDITFINGVRVGATDASTPWWWNVPRYYHVSAGMLKPHGNIVAVRLFNQWGDGGFVETENDRMSLFCEENGEISLSGIWRWAAEVCYPPRQVTTAQPCGHYHAMIAPLLPFRIRGFVWYQGENDVAFVDDYRVLFPALIKDWRSRWGGADLPFLFVQLPKYAWPTGQPGHGRLPLMREVQAEALRLPNTAMAVGLDTGEANDVHPQNKRDVGIRLALLALRRVYGRVYEDEGPRYAGMKIDGNVVRIAFTHADGLHARGDMAGFEVAGEDRRFYCAQARIEGKEIIVECDAVSTPVAVRYAWRDCPPHPLYNAAGLPAAPFRSDSWET